MTSFVNPSFSTEHIGAQRVGTAFEAVRQMGASFSGTRGLATLLLSAMAAAVMVVAYQVMDSVAEGHLLVVWMSLWAVAFAALALFAGTARTLATRVRSSLDDWSRNLAEARAEQRMWAIARTDPRVMADLDNAMLRQQATSRDVELRVEQDARSQRILAARHFL